MSEIMGIFSFIEQKFVRYYIMIKSLNSNCPISYEGDPRERRQLLVARRGWASSSPG
jgi:hypothetical protein